MEIINVPIEKIKRDTNQPRQNFDHVKIKEMAQSIKTEGVINPIEVDQSYTIVTGEMRWRAAKEAGLKTVPCKMIQISDSLRFRRQVIENIHHNTMTEWDTAKALEKLMRHPGWRKEQNSWNDRGIRQLAKEVGKSDETIRGYLSILNSSPEIKKAIKEQTIGSTMIRPIRYAPPEFQKQMEEKIIAGEFKNRDDALEVAYALKRNPEKAKEIFKAKTRDELFKISPRDSDLLRKSYEPVNELSKIVDSLVEWLRNNSPQGVGKLHAARVILNLNSVVSAINKWGQSVPELKGPSNGN